MTTNWFIARNKQKFGPFSTGQLQQLAVLGVVQPTDYVLPEGATKWVAATTVDGAFGGKQGRSQYWLSVGGKPHGPHSVQHIQAGLLRRQLGAGTLACPVGETRWGPLAQFTEFRAFLPCESRDSHAHLGVGSSRLNVTEEEAELHLAGKQGDPIARLISTLFDLRRRYADNPTMVQSIDKNIHDLKAFRNGHAGSHPQT
jgi:hypothetical protein